MTMKQLEKEIEHIGETRGAEDHDHDMIHELSRRLDSLWRYDQYISNAAEHDKIQQFWKKVKNQEQENISELKNLLSEHIKTACF